MNKDDLYTALVCGICFGLLFGVIMGVLIRAAW